jgi:C1A family cysteine protease
VYVPARRFETVIAKTHAAALALLVVGLSVLPAADTGSVIDQQFHLVARCVQLDDQAMATFEKAHPNTLPERKLKIPGPQAATFEWGDHISMNPVRDQKQTSSCWAHGTAEALECSYRIRNADQVFVSVQAVIDCTDTGQDNAANGGRMSRAFFHMVKYGAAREADYPFKSSTQRFPCLCEGTRPLATPYRAVACGMFGTTAKPAPASEIKAALLRHGPLAVSVDADHLKNYKAGQIVQERATRPDHIVLLTGWDDKKGAHGAWKLRNSWGKSWGELGYFWCGYGAMDIGNSVTWVRAVNKHYSLPAEFDRVIPGMRPAPRPSSN